MVLVEQDEEQRRRVGGSEVRRVRALPARGELAEAQLVEDLAGLLLVEVVALLGLAGGEHAQRGGRQPGQVGQRLEARDQAVAAEQRHEPRQSGRGQRRALGEVGMHAQRGEIAEARAVGASQRRVLGLQQRRAGQPLLELGRLRGAQLRHARRAARAARTRPPAVPRAA